MTTARHTTTTHAPGRRRTQRRALVLAAVAFFASAPGQSFLISVFVDDFIAGTGLSRTVFSALYAAGTVVSALAMLLLGRLLDRRGLRVGWAVVALSLALACAMASLATGAVLAFLALAMLRASGQGAFTLVGTLLVARHFGRRRGQAVALANTGIVIASVALPPVVALLIVSTDWRFAYRVLALVLVVAVLPLAVLVRDRGGQARAPDTPLTVPDAGATDAATDEAPAMGPTAVRTTRRGLPDVPTRTAGRLLVALAAAPLVGTAVTFHAVSIVSERGVGFVAAGWMVGLLGGASAIGLVVAGLAVDRLTTRSALLATCGLILMATTVLLVPTATAAVVGFVLLGIAMGSVGVVNGTVWARTFGTAQLGRVQGMAQSSMITAAAVAPVVPAASLALTGSHLAGLVVLTTVAAGALAVALVGDRHWSHRAATS